MAFELHSKQEQKEKRDHQCHRGVEQKQDSRGTILNLANRWKFFHSKFHKVLSQQAGVGLTRAL
jgi:hypothetical protein